MRQSRAKFPIYDTRMELQCYTVVLLSTLIACAEAKAHVDPVTNSANHLGNDKQGCRVSQASFKIKPAVLSQLIPKNHKWNLDYSVTVLQLA